VYLRGERIGMTRKAEEEYVFTLILWIAHNVEAKENIIIQNSFYSGELFNVISRFISEKCGLHG